MRIGEGVVEALVVIVILVALFFSVATYLITKITAKSELVVSKPLNPKMVLTTDGKKVDTVYVYKIR